MQRARVSMVVAVTALVGATLIATSGVQAAPAARKLPISGTPWAEHMRPAQPRPARAEKIAAAQATTESQCIDSTDTLVLAIDSFDPDHPGVQQVVFHRETPADAPGRARIWVAWDFLSTEHSGPDPIECDQVAELQSSADQIIDTDVHYFGDYLARGDGGTNIDILTYNVVDEAYYDPDFTSYIAGFFSSYYQELFDRNIFFLDSAPWSNGLGADAPDQYLVEGIFAHELVHLIMNDHDPDELSWVNEGLADLAVFLNGFGEAPIGEEHVAYYLAFHRNALTTWQGGLEDYGASYLFQLYLLENFGRQSANGTWDNAWTRAMVDEQANGIAGVETRTREDFSTLFDAWILANLQDDPTRTAAGGYPMGYDHIDTNPIATKFLGSWSIRRGIEDVYRAGTNGNLPISRYAGGATSGSVEFPLGEAEPYSAIYKSYGGQNPSLAVSFRGDGESGIAPAEGSFEAFSGAGGLLADRTLELDVLVGGTLTFATWFDIEEDWDYGFVEASTDGGVTWSKLAGTITRSSSNPNDSTAWANALGAATSTDAAITGASDGWVNASFDLPAASGVSVRFNYFTDEFYEGRGWYIDQVQVDGTSDGFESGAGNWTLGGWQITTGLFPNDWIGAYVNPIKRQGKPARLDIGYVDGATGEDGYERFSTRLDTSRLGNGRVVFVFANHGATDEAFNAGYLILARKKG